MIGDRFKALRSELNLRQSDFAAKLGISSAALSKIENNLTVNPRTEIVNQLIHEFNVNMEWLFSGTGEMFANSEIHEDNSTIDEYRRKTIELQEELSNVQKKLINEIEENKMIRKEFNSKLKEIVKSIKKGEINIERLLSLTFLDEM